jgi:2-oxo-4-hydroxy-4-carboxy--5-ureidoimidazoline (OHCU) decarboxylase
MARQSRFGSGIRAELGLVDYSPIARGGMAAGQAYAEAISSVGDSISGAINEYQKKKEERDTFSSLLDSKIGELERKRAEISQNPSLYGNTPLVTQEQIDSLRKMGDAKTPALKVKIAEIDSLIKNIDEAPARTLRALQINQAQQAAANEKAFGEAFSAIPATKEVVTKVPELSVTSKAPKFTGLGEFMYGSTKQETPAKTVINQAPAGTAAFLGQNQLTGTYAFLDDKAKAELALQEERLAQKRKQLDEVNTTLTKGATTPLRQIFNAPPYISERVPLSSSEKVAVANQKYALQNEVEQQTIQTNQIKERISAAEKFAGQPLTKQAGDPVLEKAANALSQFDKRVDVLKRDVEVAIKEREEKSDVPLTPDERLQQFMSTYIEKGGQITPKVLGEMKRSVGADVEHFRFGDVEGIRIGDSVKIFEDKKPISVSQRKYYDEATYNQLVSAAARAGLDRLSQEERQVLVELNNRYGSEEADIVTGVRRKRMIQDIVRDRAVELGLTPRQSEFVSTPATPSKLGASRFGIEVEKKPSMVK